MALNNGWIRIDTDSGSGDTAVSVVVLQRNTGRTITRSETLIGTTTNSATATATIKQDPMGPFITIDHVETLNGNVEVAELYPSATDYLLVGYSNVDFLSVTESSDKSYTDINDHTHGRLWENGFTIVDYGIPYTGVEPESAIHSQAQFAGLTPVVGTAEQYIFKIPFYTIANQSTTTRPVSITIEDDDNHSALFEIRQRGVST